MYILLKYVYEHSVLHFQLQINMMSVPYITIDDSDDEKEEKRALVYCQLPSCGFKTRRTGSWRKAKREVRRHVMNKHIDRRKTLAMDKCFPPHSKSKGFPCPVCYEGNRDLIKIKFKNHDQRNNHVMSRHSNYLDLKVVQRLTDMAFDKPSINKEDNPRHANIDELLMSSVDERDCSLDEDDDDSVIILDGEDSDSDRHTSIDELLKSSDDEIDVSRGDPDRSTEVGPQSLDESVVFLHTEAEEDNQRDYQMKMNILDNFQVIDVITID